MSMEVMLMADVPDLGAQGAVVRVAEGYARNFLFPRKLAAPVTEGARRRMEKLRKEREAGRQAEREAAQRLADQVKAAEVTLRVKVHEGTKLYGSVTAADITAALEKQQNLRLDRAAVEIAEPIRELGKFEVKVRLSPDIETTLKVWVVEEV